MYSASIDESARAKESNDRETFLSALESLETARLPARHTYRIVAAAPSAFTPDEGRADCQFGVSAGAELDKRDAQRYLLQGQEALSDALRPGPILSIHRSASGAGDGDGSIEAQSEIRRDEGVLWSSWVGSGAKRRRLVDHTGHEIATPNTRVTAGSGRGGQESLVKKVPMWYTVPLRYPCTCQLAIHPHAYTPALPPPLIRDLPPLSPCTATDVPAEDPSRLLAWSAVGAGDDDAAEGAGVNTLGGAHEPDFKACWRTAQGSWAKRLSGKQAQPGPLLNSAPPGASRARKLEVEVEVLPRTAQTGGGGDRQDHSVLSASSPLIPTSKISAQMRACIETPLRHTRSALPHAAPPLLDTTSPGLQDIEQQRKRRWPLGAARQVEDTLTKGPPQVGIAATATDETRSGETITSWAEEAKRRKSVWRRMIGADEGYGLIWDVIPMPHTRSAPLQPAQAAVHCPQHVRGSSGPATPDHSDADGDPKPPLTSAPPPYILPRALITRTDPPLIHPFHPDLHAYIARFGGARVHWVIPINGPVVVPTVNEHDLCLSPIGGPGEYVCARQRAGTATAEPVPEPDSEHVPVRHPLCPSVGILREVADDLPHMHPLTRPFPLLWTKGTVRQFWDKLCALQFVSDGGSGMAPEAGVSGQTGPKGGAEGMGTGVDDGRGAAPVAGQGGGRGRMFGGISLALSGPKPDPFLDLPRTPPCGTSSASKSARRGRSGGSTGRGPQRHRGLLPVPAPDVTPINAESGVQDELLNRSAVSEAAQAQERSALPKTVPALPPTPKPVMPECGDHIRIYLDARHALSFRSWLHAVQLDVPALFKADVGAEQAEGATKDVGLETGLEKVAHSRPGPGDVVRSKGAMLQAAAAGRRNLVPMSSTIQPSFAPRADLVAAGSAASAQADCATQTGGMGRGVTQRGGKEPGGTGTGTAKVRQFNKVRLALIGDRGEVLVVA